MKRNEVRLCAALGGPAPKPPASKPQPESTRRSPHVLTCSGTTLDERPDHSPAEPLSVDSRSSYG